MFKIKPSYVIIPAITLAVMAGGRFFSQSGMQWYRTLNLPFYVPPGWVFGVVWNTIFILTTAAAIIIWNNFERNGRFYAIMALFAVNAFLNVFWSYLFFYFRLIGPALFDAGAIALSLIGLITLIWPVSRRVALLLAPYLVWVLFACFMNYQIWCMN